jgi:hypothetical protein
MLKQLDTLIGFAVVMTIVSMLIMVATQAISAILALRGRSLRDGLKALFLRLAPDLSESQALALAESILKRPTISDSSLSIKGRWFESWKLGTAIRPQECLDAISKIATRDAGVLAKAFSADAAASLPDAQTAAKRVLKALETPEVAQAVDSATAALKLIAPNTNVDSVESKITALAAHATIAVQSQAQNWAKQFQSVQDRVDQWFTMHARQVTVILAFIAAFLLQLNAFELFSRLANDADLRNELVNLSPGIQKRVEDVLNIEFPGSVYSAALQELKRNGKITADPATADATTDAGARKWLTSQSTTPEVMSAYQQAVQRNSNERLDHAKSEFTDVIGLYKQSNLSLIPQPYPAVTLNNSLPFIHGVPGLLGFDEWVPRSRFFGMLATAMLLTLGSPFWFNLLKSLASLRSAVSKKIDDERKK